MRRFPIEDSEVQATQMVERNARDTNVAIRLMIVPCKNNTIAPAAPTEELRAAGLRVSVGSGLLTLCSVPDQAVEGHEFGQVAAGVQRGDGVAGFDGQHVVAPELAFIEAEAVDGRFLGRRVFVAADEQEVAHRVDDDAVLPAFHALQDVGVRPEHQGGAGLDEGAVHGFEPGRRLVDVFVAGVGEDHRDEAIGPGGRDLAAQ